MRNSVIVPQIRTKTVVSGLLSKENVRWIQGWKPVLFITGGSVTDSLKKEGKRGHLK